MFAFQAREEEEEEEAKAQEAKEDSLRRLRQQVSLTTDQP